MNDQNLMNRDQTNTDQVCEATLLSRLSIAPGLGDVHATVNNGVAVLTGNVRDAVDIKRSVLIAEAVEGIREVREKLRVVPAGEVEGTRSSVPGTRSSVPGTRSSVPATGAPAEDVAPTVDFAPGDESLNPTSLVDDISLAAVMKAGMDVFDSEGKKVGKVKEVRATDFLLTRLLAKNYYVPFFVCTVSEDGVHLNVKGTEINDQGWASPHMETP